MKRVFISHPYSGDEVENIIKADEICRQEIDAETLPISPLHLFSHIEIETPELRAAIMETCFRLIDICDEVWTYGDSPGCKEEEIYGRATGKKIVKKGE